MILTTGKVEVMKIGNEVSFTYLKGADAGIVKGVLVKDYASKAEAYAGKVVEIRDIAEQSAVE